MTEKRYTLSVAYFAGQRDEIVKGQDGYRDYFSPETLEKAAHAYLATNPVIGLFHIDGTEGHGKVVESYCWPSETPWQVGQTVVRKGDWLIGVVWDEAAWSIIKSGKACGMSPQGRARRLVTS